MTITRRRVALSGCPPEVAHYLTTGCYMAPGADFELFMLAGQAIRGKLSGLRALWEVHAAEIKRHHPGETFAGLALAGGDWEDAGLGRMNCPDHPVVSPLHDLPGGGVDQCSQHCE